MFSLPQSLIIPLLLVAYLLPGAAAAFSAADFSLYPQASRSCLFQASNATECDVTSVAAYNACVCNNNYNFLDNSAACIQVEDPSDLTVVYAILMRNCVDSNTPIAYTSDEWVAAAAKASTLTASSTTPLTVTIESLNTATASEATATTTPTPTPTPTTPTSSSANAEQTSSTSSATLTTTSALPATNSPSPSNDDHDDDGDDRRDGDGEKLSINGIVGLAVGVPCFLALTGILLMLWMRRRKPKQDDPAQERGFAGQGHGGPYGGDGYSSTTELRRPASPASTMNTPINSDLPPFAPPYQPYDNGYSHGYAHSLPPEKVPPHYQQQQQQEPVELQGDQLEAVELPAEKY